MIEHVRDLLAHGEWANAVFFHAWAKSPARDHAELRCRVAHLVGVQAGFLAVLRGENPAGPPDDPPPEVEALKTRAQASHTGLRALAGELDLIGLSRTVRIPWFPEPPCVI